MQQLTRANQILPTSRQGFRSMRLSNFLAVTLGLPPGNNWILATFLGPVSALGVEYRLLHFAV